MISICDELFDQNSYRNFHTIPCVSNSGSRTQMAEPFSAASEATKFGYQPFTYRKKPFTNQGPCCKIFWAFSSFSSLTMKYSYPKSIKVIFSVSLHIVVSFLLRYT